MKKNFFYPKILMVISLMISCVLLFTRNPFYGHDIGFHLSRIQSIADCLNNKTFPALIYPNYFDGYGYANGIFYPDLFLYIPAILVYFGIECKTAYNLFLFLINILTIACSFFCVKKITNSDTVSSIISSLYLLSTYRIADLYARSALGETICFLFVPLIILGLYEILYDSPQKGYYLVLGLFGVASSHIITLLFCVIFIILLYISNLIRLINNKHELLRRTMFLFVFCLLSVGLCAYFIFPFIEMYFSDIYMFKTAPATGGWERTIPFLLSVIELPTYRSVYYPLGIGLVFVFILIVYFKNIGKTDHFSSHMIILGLLFWFMSTDLFPWKLLQSFAQTIQFPWRFMLLASALLLFGFSPILEIVFEEKHNEKKMMSLLLFLMVFSLVCSFADMFIIYDYKFYTDDVHYSLGGVEYLPSDVDLSFISGRGDTVTSNNNINYSFEKNGTNMLINYSDNDYSDSSIELPLIYYKGYKAVENDVSLPVKKSQNGLVEVLLSNQNGSIKLFYGNTTLRVVGYFVSIISAIVLMIFLKVTAK